MPPDDPPIYLRARCTAELKRRVEQFGETKGLSESDVVRLAVLDYLKRQAALSLSEMELLKAEAGALAQMAADIRQVTKSTSAISEPVKASRKKSLSR